MYDYMKALQERFDEKQPEHLVYAVQSAREGLRDGIDAESRRKLLRLLDAQNALLVEAKLMSFTAGFKLAAGIAGELGAPYCRGDQMQSNGKGIDHYGSPGAGRACSACCAKAASMLIRTQYAFKTYNAPQPTAIRRLYGFNTHNEEMFQ